MTRGVPRPLAIVLSAAGEKAVTESAPAKGQRVPAALATNTRELLGNVAAWVGFRPASADPIAVSPETSIWMAVPGFAATLVLRPKTAWKFAGFGGGVNTGSTTGR